MKMEVTEALCNKYDMMCETKYGGDLDVQKFLGNIPVGAPWSKYPGEKHLFGHNFTGPGTRLDLRLNSDGTPKPDSKPINRVDAAALKHDKFYEQHTDKSERHQADLEMIEELKNIPNPTLRERVERALVIKALQLKVKLGVGMGGNVKAAALDTYANELHKPFRKPKMLLKVKVFNKDDIWSADLVEMPKNFKYHYILTIIDLYTKYAWAVPLTNKRGETVAKAFEKIFKESGRTPKKLWVDRGKEFYNKNMKELGIEIYSTFNDGKAVVIERFNRTLKSMMFKEFTKQGNQQWLKILPGVIERYNNKVHRTIGVTPVEASNNPDKIRDNVINNQYANELQSKRKNASKYKVGDRVRIFKWKSLFEKGYKANWTNEIFVVSEVNKTVPVTYQLKDLEGEEIYGKFYENELQKTEF